MKHLYALILPLLLCSCASVFNGRYTATHIVTNPSNATIIVNGRDTTCCSDKIIALQRSPLPLRLEIKKDTLQQGLLIQPKLSNIYFLNVLYWPALIVDLFNDKRFTYPEEIYVDLYNPKNSYQPYCREWTKNDDKPLNIGLSIPIISDYYYSNANVNNNLWGSLGLGLNAEYFLNKKYYLSAELGWMEHNTSRLFLYYPYITTHQKLTFINSRINTRIKRWNFGAGLSYQQFNMERTFYNESNDSLSVPPSPIKDTSYQIAKQYHEGLGLNFSAQYQLGKNFYIGTMFQPLLFNTASSAKGYMHYINIDFIFKVPVWKRK